jgi:PKD repeat protein
LAPLTVAFTDTSTGGASAWAWDFGDGDAISFQQHPTYTYDLPGNYTVTLTVTRTEPVSSAAVIKLNLITVTKPPLQADFTAEPRSGLAPLTVAFTDTSTGGASAWAWDFGDGDAISFQQHPTYTYNLPGNYTVTLTVTRTEPVSSVAVIKPNLITVTEPSLKADFEAEPRSGLAPLLVTFTDISTGDVLTRTWDFGDGGTAHLPGTAVWPHTYTYSGHFTVSLTVQDAYTSSTVVKRDFIRVTEVVCTVYLPVVLRD